MANRVVVAGGGASGLVAAVFAAGNGAEVTILEHKDRIGKKILMTGNGRCNLTNMSDVRGKYYSSDEDSLNRIYDTLVRFDAVKTRDFFKRLGLYTKEKKDGGVYPVSEQAAVPSAPLSPASATWDPAWRPSAPAATLPPSPAHGEPCISYGLSIRRPDESPRGDVVAMI